MAKKSMIAREEKRIRMVAKYAEKKSYIKRAYKKSKRLRKRKDIVLK